jgi:hypothetical protein
VLQAEMPFQPVYEYVSNGIPSTGNPITINSNTFVEIARLNPAGTFEAGTYEIGFGAVHNYSNTSRSAIFSWSIDGGVSWEEFTIEPKDSTDNKALHYPFPYEHLGGGIDLVFAARCENSNDTLTVDYANITFERKR